MFRRSLYIAKDMLAGDVFTKESLRIVRPGQGLHPRHYEEVLGRRAASDAKKGTPLSWGLIA
jgi:N-acetylneuraminate synthase